LAAEGKIQKEYLGALDGSAANQSFYTARFPITTDVGVTTDAETEVDVFTNDLTPGSWSEYADDGSAFLITGATGEVEIQAAENQGGNINERISISYYTTETPAVAQGATIVYDQEIRDVYQLGDEDPQELKEGTIAISGTIALLWTNRSMSGTYLGKSDFYKKLAAYSLYLYPNKEVTGQPRFKVGSVKFSGGRIDVGIDTILAENVSYKGLVLSEDTVPA